MPKGDCREQAGSVRRSLLLASASPRRRSLIGILGLPVEAMAAEVDESPRPRETPEQLTARLARMKAEALASIAGNRVVVGADSVVVLDGRALGKPSNPDEAGAMLRALRGRSHQVATAVALLDAKSGARYQGLVSTTVSMRPYGDKDIATYVRTGSPMDKAGAYGLQDLFFRPVERLTGCYLNVVGLPLCEIARGLEALGARLPRLAERPLEAPCGLCRQGAEIVQVGGGNRLFPGL